MCASKDSQRNTDLVVAESLACAILRLNENFRSQNSNFEIDPLVNIHPSYPYPIYRPPSAPSPTNV